MRIKTERLAYESSTIKKQQQQKNVSEKRVWIGIGRTWNKFVLITKNSAKFSSSVDHPKCDDVDKHLTHLSAKTNFKGAVFLNEWSNERTNEWMSDFIKVSMPSSEHDFLSKNSFSYDKPVSQFSETWIFSSLHLSLLVATIRIVLSRQIMNTGFRNNFPSFGTSLLV
jgi:hypothetical protein